MKIKIEDYPISLKIGHFQAEREFVRTVFVSLSLVFEAPKEEHLENLTSTIDYGEVLEFLERKFSGKTIRLIETLLYLVAKELMFKFSLLEEVVIHIEKTHMRPSLVKGARVTVQESFKRKHFPLDQVASCDK
jgi:dihydroneopterin aldolase